MARRKTANASRNDKLEYAHAQSIYFYRYIGLGLGIDNYASPQLEGICERRRKARQIKARAKPHEILPAQLPHADIA